MMNLEDRLRYRGLQRKSLELYNVEKYEEAMKIDKELVREFPELKTAIYYSLIAASSKLMEYQLSCDYLQEILDEGGWYSELILRQSPSLVPLQGNPQFENLAELSISRSKQFSGNENITIIPDHLDPPFPFLLSLHGGGGFIHDEYQHWKSIVDQGYILGIPLSPNRFWSGLDGAYWPDYESSLKIIKDYIADINRKKIIDFERLVLGGFSQGGGIALQMAISGDIPACGFMVVSPGGGDLIDDLSKWQSIIDRSANEKLSGVIIRGTEDLAIPRDKLYDLQNMLNDSGIICKFIEYPGLGHWYPNDLVELIIPFLSSQVL